MSGKDFVPSSSEPAGHDRARRDPEIEKTGRGGPIEHGEAGGGAMTGETGNLTGHAATSEAFVPGELREMSDPLLQGEMTARSRDASAEHRVEVETEGGREGPDVSPPAAGQLATEAASGIGHLQGQGTPLGGGGDVGARGRGGGPGPTELAGRESGYGSGHGLAKDDPAYRVEEEEEGEEVTPEAHGRQDQPDRF
jgi:hypothetical protein